MSDLRVERNKTSEETEKSENSDKASLGDLVRLLQLRKELAGEQPRKGRVRWIDGCERPSSGS
jgi:hypothetical protein